MTNNDYLLEFEARKKIYNFISEYPGLNRSELSRKMNIPYTTIKYHLIYLKKRGYILEKHEDKYSRYYVVKEVGRREKEIFKLLRQDIPRRIVILLLYTRPCYWYPEIDYNKIFSASFESMYTFSKKELVEMEKCCKNPENAKRYSLRKHRTTIDYHLNKLLDAGIIEKVPSGREMRYRIKDLLEIYIFVNKYKNAFSCKIVDLFVYYIRNRTDKVLDLFIENIFSIFPHPYHV
jgi:predicted transcriptional regulator